MITALFYIAVNVSLWAVPVQSFYHGKFGGVKNDFSSFWWIWLSIIVLNVLVFTVPPIAAAVSIRSRDL